MHRPQSIKARGIVLPLVLAMGACGGGGGNPGGNPNKDNSPATQLHPASHVELWWSECSGNAPCAPSGTARTAH